MIACLLLFKLLALLTGEEARHYCQSLQFAFAKRDTQWKVTHIISSPATIIVGCVILQETPQYLSNADATAICVSRKHKRSSAPSGKDVVQIGDNNVRDASRKHSSYPVVYTHGRS